MNLFGSNKSELVEVATSYREFGVPFNLSKEWIQQKYGVSEKKAESACSQAYWH